MENDKISIIIPIYKVEAYLDKCIASVCAQTYRNLEIILVDDGSPDRCGEMADEWAKKDARIRVIHQKNQGVSVARNAGLDIAGGDYIGYADPDDFLAPDMYEKLYARLVGSGCEIVMCAFEYVRDEGEGTEEKNPVIPGGIMAIDELIAIQHDNTRNRFAVDVVWNKLFPRKIVEGLRFEGEAHGDTVYTNRYLPRVKKVAILEDKLYYYYQRANGIIGQGFRANKRRHFYTLLERIDICEQQGFCRESARVTAVRALNEGVDYWISIAKGKLLSKKEEKAYFRDVAQAIRKYSHYGSKKQKLYWNFFRVTPHIFKTLYLTASKLRNR